MNKLVEKIKSSSLFQFFSDHVALLTALVALSGTIGSLFISYSRYLVLLAKFHTYGIPVEYLKINSSYGFADLFLQGLLVIGMLISIAFSYVVLESGHQNRLSRRADKNTNANRKISQRINSFLKRSFVWVVLFVFIIAPINLAIILILLRPNLSQLRCADVISLLIGVLGLFLIEVLVSFLMLKVLSKNPKKPEEDTSQSVELNALAIVKKCLTSSLVLMLFFFCAGAYFYGYKTVKDNKSYYITSIAPNEDYAIVYWDDNRCILLKCIITGNDIRIDTNVQRVIENTNISYTKKMFINVDM